MVDADEELQHRFLVRCKEAYELVQGFLNDTLPWGPVPKTKSGYHYDKQKRDGVKKKVTESITNIEESIRNHGLEEIAISYNGGKDCLVMLILILALIHKRIIREESSKNVIPLDYKLDSIYINSEDPFPELSSFITKSTGYYHLNPIIIKATLREGFEKYLKHNPKIKAIVVGIRRSDPYGGRLVSEQMTDHKWPRFLRIHPILEWTYTEIWDFLIGCNLEYCSMYDLGYTSLGGVHTTIPNPCLKKPDVDEYYPAYMLEHDADEKERLGRITSN